MSNMIEFRCSELARLELCPGSKAAAARVRDIAGASAESGTRVHAALSQVITFESLEQDAEAMKTRCKAVSGLSAREAGILAWFAEIVRSCLSGENVLEVVKEEQVKQHWVTANIGAECPSQVVVSGSPDLLVRTAQRVHVIEYKTGMGDQDTAEGHVQGQAYSLFAAEKWAVQEVRLHILAAGNERGREHTYCDYADEGLAFAQGRIQKIITAAAAANAPRIVGESQCRWCKAGGTQFCPESCMAVEKFGANIIRMDNPVAVFLAMPPEKRVKVVEAIRTVTPLMDKILDAAKEGLQNDPTWLPDYEITAGSQTVEVEDAKRAFELLKENDSGITGAEFSECCKVSLPALKKAFHKIRVARAEAKNVKPPSQKDSDTILLGILQPISETKTRAGSLKKVKT